MSPFTKFIQFLEFAGILVDQKETGSRVICSPTATDTDDDRLILVSDLNAAGFHLSCEGWTNCLKDWETKESRDPAEAVNEYEVELEGGARFQAWRNGEVNVIVTDDETLHLRSRAATLLAKELNLLDKSERVGLFRAIKFGEKYGGRMQ